MFQGALKSETVLPLFEESERAIASQNDRPTFPFGAHRRNVGKVVDSHEYESDDKVSASSLHICISANHTWGNLSTTFFYCLWGHVLLLLNSTRESGAFIPYLQLHLSESVIPRHMLGSVQSHDLEPLWGNLRSQASKIAKNKLDILFFL